MLATDFRVEEGQTYTQHAVLATACMDRPAADMCAGRAGHCALLACGFGPPGCAGETCGQLEDGDDLESVLPKKGKHKPATSTVTWQRLLEQDKITATLYNEPNTDAILEVTTTTLSLRLVFPYNRLCQVLKRLLDAERSDNARSELAAIAKETGWVSLGFLGKLALKIGFDLVRDLVVDLMHLCMVLIKDLAYVTAGVIAKVRAFKPSHNRLSRYFQVNTWAAGMFVDHMLYDFRLNVPPVFSTGRRFARDVRDGSICSWTAEECLNFARITWRWFFQQFYMMLDRTGNIDNLDPIDLASLDAVVGAWELFEGWLFPAMDRNGLSLSLGDFSQRCVRYALYLKNHRINGKRTFPVTLQTHTLHCLGAHLWRYFHWWGNVREHQCFCFERVASELTQTLSAWNGRGEGGSFLARKLRWKQASRSYVDRHITGCDITGCA